MSGFKTSSGFCPDCGTILPSIKSSGDINCYNCDRNFTADVFGNMKVTYTINFNSRDVYEKNKVDRKKGRKNKNDDEEEGPVVERKCPKCGNERMSYATLQLRSADEGQTIFYTCTKCKHKETENS